MLIDEVVITIKAGNGGDGAVTFHREKYVAKGGPDGGDGAKGGDIYILASPSTHGLTNYQGRKHYAAEDGEGGGKKRCSGKAGEDLVLAVPPGTRATEIFADGTEQLLIDLTQPNEPIKLARGGKGGKGNWHFKSATHQTPMEFQPGKPGESKTIRLELQMLADVGLVGLPNSGKSTLLSVISNAQPKIANYPFTTLEPNLGMVSYYDQQFVVADIPGLIEGAAAGKGLGHEFLKHILRTNVIVHLIAATEEEPGTTYQTVRQELAAFDKTLLDKPEVVVVSKIDLFTDWHEYHQDFIKAHQAIGISAATKTGVDELLKHIAQHVTDAQNANQDLDDQAVLPA